MVAGMSSYCTIVIRVGSKIAAFAKSTSHESVHNQRSPLHLTQASKHEILAMTLALSKRLTMFELLAALKSIDTNKP